ncbi:MAG: M20 family peptidase, partial [Zetaproteobacteria bacterium]
MTARGDAILGWLGEHAHDAIGFLEALVNQDSGTYDRVAVNRVGDLLAA